METEFTKIAAKIRSERLADSLQHSDAAALRYQEEQLALLKQFEQAFGEELPLLHQAGIKCSAHWQDHRYGFKGSYILFELDGRELKMDFSSAKSYRYEFVPYGSGRSGRMTYGEWPKDDFYLFIDENLINLRK